MEVCEGEGRSGTSKHPPTPCNLSQNLSLGHVHGRKSKTWSTSSIVSVCPISVSGFFSPLKPPGGIDLWTTSRLRRIGQMKFPRNFRSARTLLGPQIRAENSSTFPRLPQPHLGPEILVGLSSLQDNRLGGFSFGEGHGNLRRKPQAACQSRPREKRMRSWRTRSPTPRCQNRPFLARPSHRIRGNSDGVRTRRVRFILRAMTIPHTATEKVSTTKPPITASRATGSTPGASRNGMDNPRAAR